MRSRRFCLSMGVLLSIVLILSGATAFSQSEEQSSPLLGLNYGPFRNEQSPQGALPSTEQIAEDMALIAQKVPAIRIYNMVYGPTNNPQNLGEQILIAAAENDLEVVIQAWIGPDLNNNEREIAAVIDAANRYENVIKIIVGSEVLLRNDLPAEQLITYIQRVRQNTPITIPVGYADDFTRWMANPEVAEVVDWIGLHSYGFFSCQSAEQSPAFTVGQWGQMLALPAFSNKPISLLETGWPTTGTHDNCSAQVLDETAQQQFVKSIIEIADAAQLDLYLFEFADEPWKCYTGDEGLFGCHWGLVDVNRKPKPAWNVLPDRTSKTPGAVTIQTTDQSPVDCISGPSADLPVVASLLHGTEVTVLGNNPDKSWLLIQANEQTCWVDSQFVSGGEELQPTPTSSPTTQPSSTPNIIGSNLSEFIELADATLCQGDPKFRWDANAAMAASCVKKLLLSEEAQAVIQQGMRRNQSCELPPTIAEKTSYFEDYWALTDISTAYFILGQKLAEIDQIGLAQQTFEIILSEYDCAWAWDEDQQEFWWVAQGARHELVPLGWDSTARWIPSGTTLAEWIESADPNLCPEIDGEQMLKWDADLNTAAACAHNLRIWNEQAVEQQNARQQSGTCDEQPQPSEIDRYFEDNWALNNVGTGFFILGKKLAEAGNIQLAREAFELILSQHSCAWVWDPANGWFWSLAQGAHDELRKLQEEDSLTCPNETSLATWIDCAIPDLCPGTQSQQLVRWNADLETATACALGLQIWEDQANQQQNTRQQSGVCDVQPQPVEKDGYFASYWAVTDVGTGYFILGKQLKQAGKTQLACEAFELILSQYSCAWVWDSQGWFWSLAQGASDELRPLSCG